MSRLFSIITIDPRFDSQDYTPGGSGRRHGDADSRGFLRRSHAEEIVICDGCGEPHDLEDHETAKTRDRWQCTCCGTWNPRA